MNNKKQNLRILIIILLFMFVVVTIFYLYSNKQEELSKQAVEKINNQTYTNTTPKERKINYSGKQLWENNKKINDDYVGELVFDSNLINTSFVQAKSIYDKNNKLYHCYNIDGTLVKDADDKTGNDVYMYTNWKDMSYDYTLLGGSIFMDYRNTLDDINIILYGHHFSEGGGNDPKRIKAFTPLEKLLNQKNYEDNKSLKLFLENEIREYVLAHVYIYDENDEYFHKNCQYWRTNYFYDEFNETNDETYYQNYISVLNEKELYDTDIEISTDIDNPDRTLTLQTCISNHAGELYEILVFKEISRNEY